MLSDPNVEFSRIVLFDQIGVTGATYHLEAKQEECRRLAVRFNLVAIHQMCAHFVLTQAEEPGCFQIEGEVSGDVVQSCVSTLKDVPAHVYATFILLLRPSREETKDEEFIIDLEDERDIEYYTENQVDLGETAAQYLFLNLDPFPHAPDAPEFIEAKEDTPINPLAEALKGIKKK
ncbi:MAG: DUF177 domain-containing protein [Alphaproteobacteria bacterium]|jgi:hypothetical protein|nr:DUF177 domain-containing protein [Alphaproteobacteria bacterium]